MGTSDYNGRPQCDIQWRLSGWFHQWGRHWLTQVVLEIRAIKRVLLSSEYVTQYAIKIMNMFRLLTVMLTRTFHLGPGQGLHSQWPRQGPVVQYLRTRTWANVVTSVWTFQAFKLMQKTWEKYNEMEVNLKRGEIGTYTRQLRPMSNK